MAPPKAPLPSLDLYTPPQPMFCLCPQCGVLTLRDPQTRALASALLGLPHACVPVQSPQTAPGASVPRGIAGEAAGPGEGTVGQPGAPEEESHAHL